MAKVNLVQALNEVKAENFNKGIFNMPCYKTFDGRVAAFGIHHIYYYRDLDSLNCPLGKEGKWWEPEEERFLGNYECQKNPTSTKEEVLDFFEVNERSDIGSGFHISELMYAPKEFLYYLKGLRDWGLTPSNCQGWQDRDIRQVKDAFYEGKTYSELVGVKSLPEWVEDSLNGVSKYRNAKIFKSFLVKNKADWKWQRKSLKFWYDKNHGDEELKEAFNSIREINTSFAHTWAASAIASRYSPTKMETSSYEINCQVYSININGVDLYAGLEKAKGLSIDGNTFKVIVSKGAHQENTIYFLWEENSEFRFHFEGASIKDAYKKWRDKELTSEEIIIRDGISFANVKNMGYCLAGTKAFLQRRAPFIFNLIKEYENKKYQWDTVPEDVMKLVFYPTPEFAQAIINRY